jgi:hypothetical protein
VVLCSVIQKIEGAPLAGERDELLISTMLEIGALIALLDRKGLLCKEEVLAEIK